MSRHRFVPFARLPRKRAFSDIMQEYTSAYRVSDDPVWRNVPVLQVKTLETVHVSHWDGSWVEERYRHTDYPYVVNGRRVDSSKLVVTTRENNRVESFEVNSYVSPVLHSAFTPSVHLTADKRRANRMFASLIQQFRRDGDMVMVLDSPEGQTVNMLRTIVPADCLYVANPDTRIAADLFAHAQWHGATALEFIRDYPVNRPTHYWLDYCCTFDGCASKTVPKLDIRAIFCRGDLPRYDGVICLTFSLRCYQEEALSLQVQRFLRQTARQYGYKITMVASVFFYKRIAFFRFLTKK